MKLTGWWLDMFARTQHIIHLGRRHAWVIRQQASTMALVGEVSLDGIELTAPEGLSARLLDLAQAVQGRTRWTLLLDSCWLPITTFPTLDQAWMPHELKALACHRWATLYGEAHAPWVAQTSYLPGDASATVFGIPSRLKAQLLSFSQSVLGKAVSIQPTLLWAFHHFSHSGVPKGQRQAWLWCEQDRCITAIGHRGHLHVVAPGLDKRTADGSLADLLSAEVAAQVDSIVVAGVLPSLTWPDTLPTTLHGKPLNSCTVLAQHNEEATS